MKNLKNAVLKKESDEKREINTSEDFAEVIAKFLDSKKAKKITVLDIRGKTIIADYFVIAGANSSTQVKSLSDNLDEFLSKNYAIEPIHRDLDSKWAAIDYGTVIVHILQNEAREFYQLERLWNDGDNIRVMEEIE